MHKRLLRKPDGRALTLYAREPFRDATMLAPSPFSEPLRGHAHLRWHPLRGEWVTYASHRQDRTFLPPPTYDPLAPTTQGGAATEVPSGHWDVAVFDNRFPALGGGGLDGDQAPLPALAVETASADGHCEVVVYTPDRTGSLGALSVDHIELLLSVWADRSTELGGRDDIAWVFPFENRGPEVGATLSHPHGQIYAYPVLPPVPARMATQSLESLRAHGRGTLDLLIESELRDDQRLIYRGPHAVAFVPVCARYPYEVWVATIAPVARFADLDPAQRADLARALKTVVMKYDGLWQRPMPYLMAWYQAPADGLVHPEAHLHAQFLPAHRSRDRLKYLAGTEIGAGFFAMDVLPEATARELQAVVVSLD